MASRGAYATGLARREAILQAASDVFAAHGYRGASLALIAERAGMSAPGLLHHFPTKEHLLVDLLALRRERDSAHLEALTSVRGGRILDALLTLASRNAESPGLVRLFTILAAESVDDDHPGHDWFVERYRRSREFVAERLIEEQRVGLVRDDVDAEVVAAQILATFDGLQLQWLLEPDAVDMVTVLDDYLGALRSRLAPFGSGPRTTSGASARSRTRGP
jgi:AcrR family transcriptional regulator